MPPSFTERRDTVRRGARLHRDSLAALRRARVVTDEVRRAHRALVAESARSQLDELDIDALREVTSANRLQLAPLRQAQINTVGQLLRISPAELDRLPGLGQSRVRAIVTAAAALERAAVTAQRVRLDPQRRDLGTDRLVSALAAALPMREPVGQLSGWEADIGVRLAAAVHAAKPASNRVRWLLAGAGRQNQASAAVDEVARLMLASASGEQAAATILQAPTPTVRQAWTLFATGAAEFYAELERLTGASGPVSVQLGGLATEIVLRVQRQELDETLLRGSLRAYQHFGARFILAQRRVILGDEMGLGKTFQAIAALAHLGAHGASHFVVICPASVLVNWGRELHARTRLAAHRLHGVDRDQAMADWQRLGGVAVTTFETLQALDWPPLPIAAVVVDEAHFIKNPQAKRTQACAALLAASPHAVLLTGTPLENRVEEFRALVELVQPQLAAHLDRAAMRLGAAPFRRAVAPVYLRRNQADVLIELPERIDTDEWVQLGPAEEFAYRRAVLSGNWMAIRQAAYAADASTKLSRLVELCDEAAANQRQVVVFSFFLDVLDQVCRALGDRALGPLTGASSPDARQELLDQFSTAAIGSVLVIQVQAGGVGLNIQTASVVIMCEPQLKPSTEAQAIARVHRMGQVSTVDVHRLCAENTIDEHLVEILADKQQTFDDFVARSTLAEASEAASDPSHQQLASRLIEVERARLGA